MIRSHLLDAFLATAWYLHGEVYDRLSDLLEAHVLGGKEGWRVDQRTPLSFIFDDEDKEPVDERDADRMDDGIVTIQVRGVLSMHADQVNGECQPQGRSYESIIDQLDAAEADPDCRAIILRLETPGGSAAGCQEAYDRIRSASKPVHAYVDSYCFSAGYYLAAACQTITASSRAANIGSIGTILALWDMSRAYEKSGMQRVVVRAGAYKAPAIPGEAIGEGARAELQREVDAYGAAFHDAVRAGRGLTDEQADQVLNGRTFLAEEAIGLGLADAVATFSTFIAGLAGTNRKEPSMFKKKEQPASESGHQDGLDKQTFARLAAAHPDALDRITALDGEGQSADQIERTLLAEANEQLRAEAADLRAATDAHATELQDRDQKIADLQAKLQSVTDWKDRTDQPDPGSNQAAEAALGEPLSDSRLKQEWSALSPERQAHFGGSFDGYCYARRESLIGDVAIT